MGHCWVETKLFVISTFIVVGYFGWIVLLSPLAKADKETA